MRILIRVHGPALVVAGMLLGAAPGTAQTSSGTGPFSRAELVAYLKSIPHYQSGTVPYEIRKAAHEKLTELIKQRGVDFVLDGWTFDKELYDAGISPLSRAAIAENYRKPGTATTTRTAVGSTAPVTQPQPTPPAPGPASGERPFSRTELLAALRAIPHYQNGSIPYEVRKAAHLELTERITQRGVDFILDGWTFDREFYEAGASQWSREAIAENYRGAGAASPSQPAARPVPVPAPASAPAPAPAPGPLVTSAPPARTVQQGAVQPPVGQGPFTRAELLAYLRNIPHSQDASVPYDVRKEAHDRLTRLVKQRGVDFILSMGTFDREFYEAGASSMTRWAIAENYRARGTAAPPLATLSYFSGRWSMGAAGMTTRHDREGSAVIRTDRMTGAVGGFLEIESSGTYVWQHDQASGEIRGRWRPATEQELGTEGGAAIVLLGGYDGGNWIVAERPSDVPGEHITVSHVAERYRYFIGSR